MEKYRVVDLEEEKDNPEYKEVKEIVEKIQGLWFQSAKLPGYTQPVFLEGINPSKNGEMQILFKKGIPKELFTPKGSCGLIYINHELEYGEVLKFINVFKEAFDIEEAPRHDEKLVQSYRPDILYSMSRVLGLKKMKEFGLVRPERYINENGIYEGKFAVRPKINGKKVQI